MAPRKKKITPPDSTPQQARMALRKYVENFYDFQERRLQVQLRTTPKAAGAEMVLAEFDKIKLEESMERLMEAEKIALDDITACLNRIPFYRDVLSDKTRYKGIGPTMAGVILSSFDIVKADTSSKMWAFAGLAPEPCKRCKICDTIVEPIDQKSYSRRYVHVKQWRTQVLPKCKERLRFPQVDASKEGSQDFLQQMASFQALWGPWGRASSSELPLAEVLR